MEKSSNKQKLIQLIHVAKGKTQICTCGKWIYESACSCGAETGIKMDDDAYRAFMEGITGKDSTIEMNIAELQKVLDAFRRKGFVSNFNLSRYQSKEKTRMIASVELRAKETLGDDWQKRITGFIKKTYGKETLKFCSMNELRTTQAFISRVQKRQQPQYK